MDLKEKAGSSRDAVLSQAPAWEKTNTVFTNEKAGMEGVDKDKIKKIIYEMSKVPFLISCECTTQLGH